MSGIIYFTSGKTLEITDREMREVAPKLQGGGIRLHRVSTGFIPLNSNTMEYIERVESPEEKKEAAALEAAKLEMAMNVEKQIATMEKATKPEEKPMSDQEKADAKMADMIAKSNCEHEPEKMEMFQQATAKGVRFFPVCSYCGKRERYVKADSLSEEVKINAKVWND